MPHQYPLKRIAGKWFCNHKVNKIMYNRLYNMFSRRSYDGKVKELAAQYQQAGNNCAETVVKVCNDCLDLKLPPETLRIVSVLGGGVAGSGCLCGALNGACLVLAVSSPHDAGGKDEGRSQSACAGIPENLARPLPCDVLPRPQESGQRRSRIVRRPHGRYVSHAHRFHPGKEAGLMG